MRFKASIVALALTLPSSSCIAVVAGAAGAVGYVQWDKNEAHQDFRAEMDAAWEATQAALEELGYASPERKVEILADRIEVHCADVRVELARHPDDIVRIGVRVGTFDSSDHRRRAALILEEIEERLQRP